MRAINSAVMKVHNRRLVLDLIRRRPISRAELAEQTLLTRASITQIVDELMHEGLVAETAVVGRNHLGRRMTQLALVPDARYFIGLNIGKSEYDLGVINMAGEVLQHSTGAIADRDILPVLDEICALVRRILEQLQIPFKKVYGMGVCAPGPLDVRSGVILDPENFEKWHNLAIADEIQRRLGFDVILESIFNAHALDEMYFGAGRIGVENFMLLRIDEAVGAGMVLQNRLFTGANGQGPEIGHITVCPDGPPCPCGKRGCLKQYVAFPAILKDTPFQSWRQAMDQHESSPEAQHLLLRVADVLGDFVVNILNLFDLDRIVISGYLQYRGEILTGRLTRHVQETALPARRGCEITSGGKLEISRIAAMPVYHSMFAL